MISASFGFKELIQKIGVERRVYTAGKNKSTLDPFVDAKQEDINRLKNIQLDLHKDFINVCLLYTSPSPRDLSTSRMPSSA